MNETHTFITADGRFQFTVDYAFYKRWKNSDIWSEDVYNLMTMFNLSSYLHNPIGPAIVDLATGYCTYFVNGKQLGEEEGKKLQFNSDFNDHLTRELGL